MGTNIEWTDVTDNIIAVKGGGWWCRKISAGCANCYAAKLNQNAFYGGNKLAYSGAVPELILRRELIDSWARQRKPKRHFVASMTDVFGDLVEWEWIYAFLDGMRAAPAQTFQLLTKRPGLASNAIRSWLSDRNLQALPENVWIGTSVENGDEKERIYQLLGIPAKVRFLSCEPLLGPVEIRCPLDKKNGGDCQVHPEGCPKIHWVIAGGESGLKARPMHPDWARSLRDQCQAAGVPFLFKQWGEWCPATAAHGLTGHVMPESGVMPCGKQASWIGIDGKMAVPSATGLREPIMAIARMGKNRAGRELDGRTWDEFPE